MVCKTCKSGLSVVERAELDYRSYLRLREYLEDTWRGKEVRLDLSKEAIETLSQPSVEGKIDIMFVKGKMRVNLLTRVAGSDDVKIMEIGSV